MNFASDNAAGVAPAILEAVAAANGGFALRGAGLTTPQRTRESEACRCERPAPGRRPLVAPGGSAGRGVRVAARSGGGWAPGRSAAWRAARARRRSAWGSGAVTGFGGRSERVATPANWRLEFEPWRFAWPQKPEGATEVGRPEPWRRPGPRCPIRSARLGPSMLSKQSLSIRTLPIHRISISPRLVWSAGCQSRSLQEGTFRPIISRNSFPM
jgi:hypothetical protein